jgi:hypothetical protein
MLFAFGAILKIMLVLIEELIALRSHAFLVVFVHARY